MGECICPLTLLHRPNIPSFSQEIRHDTKSHNGWRLSYAKHEEDTVKQEKMYAYLAKLRDGLMPCIRRSRKEAKRHMRTIAERKTKATASADLKSAYAKREAEFLQADEG